MHDEQEGDQAGRLRAGSWDRRGAAPTTELEHQPDRVGIERDRQQQVGGQPVVADRGAVDEARGDHRPAQRALQAAQHEQGKQSRLAAGRRAARAARTRAAAAPTARPISRPHRRCRYSSQKICWNSATVKPRFTNRPCGEERYFCSSACHAWSPSGGSQPVTGFHSTIDRPDSVSRVSAPSTIMKKIMAATTISQLRTEAGAGCMRAGPCVKPSAPSSALMSRTRAALRRPAGFANRFAYERITPRAIWISRR